MKDVLINYAFSLCIPKIIFKLATATNNHNGHVGVVSSLKQMSIRQDIEGGVAVFVIIGIVSYQVSAYCIYLHYKHKIEKDRLFLKLRNTDAILAQIETYTISKALIKQLQVNYVLRH